MTEQMDAKADEKWRVGYNPGPVVEKRFRGLLWNTVDTDEVVVALNALQQQLADAEAKAARYEEALVMCSDYYGITGMTAAEADEKYEHLPVELLYDAMLVKVRTALNPPSPITPGEVQG